MNWDLFPLNELLERLDPETRQAITKARFRLALEGANEAETVAILTAFGYLYQLLTGQIAFDRWELRGYLNLGTQDDTGRRKNHPQTTAVD